METIGRLILSVIAALILMGGLYGGIHTALDPIWFVDWRNRLNGEPRRYPLRLRNQWWAQWNAMIWDPDRVRKSPALSMQYRGAGLVVAALAGVLLLAVIGSWIA